MIDHLWVAKSVAVTHMWWYTSCHLMLGYSWANVEDGGPTLTQHRVNTPFLLTTQHVIPALCQCWASIADGIPSLRHNEFVDDRPVTCDTCRDQTPHYNPLLTLIMTSTWNDPWWAQDKLTTAITPLTTVLHWPDRPYWFIVGQKMCVTLLRPTTSSKWKFKLKNWTP